MERDFTILRDPGLVFPRDPYGGIRSMAREAEPAPEVEVAALDKHQLRDVVREPGVRAVAPVIPTTLIWPVAAEDPGADLGPDETYPGIPAGPTWGIQAVGADQSAWTGAGVTVAVLDTGIDQEHPAFAGVELVQHDFSGSGLGDLQGHGTHCAGTVFGRDVDGTRIGVARGVERALIGKVLGDDGGGTSDMIFRGIQWAVQEGASVISMSLGFDFPGMVRQLTEEGWPPDLATSSALEGYRANIRMFDALMGVVRAQAAFTAGTILVAAAGNESRREVDPAYEVAASIPAAADGVVSVGALGQSDGGGFTIAPFSNTFPQISAPGVDVLSAEAGTSGLVSFSGTSMATPHVAGLLALWWEQVLASPVPATAATVLARAVAHADPVAISSAVDVADRGVGLIKAP